MKVRRVEGEEGRGCLPGVVRVFLLDLAEGRLHVLRVLVVHVGVGVVCVTSALREILE